jgi:hypothetical protein
MNALVKKAAVAKYGPLLKSEAMGTAEIEAELRAEVTGKDGKKKYSDADVIELLEAILDYKPEPPKTAAKKEKVNSQAGEHSIAFEEWSVEPRYKNHPAQRGNQPWREFVGFTRIKKVKDTTTNQRHADVLNEQSENTLLRLYTKDEIAEKVDA